MDFLKNYNGFCISRDKHVIGHICCVLQDLARTDMYFKRPLIPLLMVMKR